MEAIQPNVIEFEEIFAAQRKRAISLRTAPLAFRKENLRKLKRWIHQNRNLIHQAMYADFKKASAEVDAIELFHVLNEIKLALEKLDSWARPKNVDAPLTMLGTRSWVYYEPKGVVLIISPWNYPFSLCIGPLVAALAAGNSAMIKPSEHTPAVSALLVTMAEELFPSDLVAVIQGDAAVSERLLRLPFDHIFFTGSPSVGKIVMKAAAENLSSVTLELGGKSPAIVTASSNILEAAERLTVAKFVNNGQTCIAPDYVLVHESKKDVLIRTIKEVVTARFGTGGNFKSSESYCRIVNRSHFERLNGIIDDAAKKGATIECLEAADRADNFLPPVIIHEVPNNTRLMDEEIFGPVLPIIAFRNLQEAIELVNEKPKPLALYIFSGKQAEVDTVLAATSSGGVCINDSGIHFLHQNLPFGGIGNSGIGRSHGHHGFLAFSNEKAVLRQKSGLALVKLFYPPYTASSRKLMDWFLKFF